MTTKATLHGRGPVTERLWLTDPARKTALAEVIATRGDRFALDRSLFCPKSHAYRHVQKPDRGIVWTHDGEKRRLVSVFEEDGVLWHRLRGTTPDVGATLNCHLDQSHRAETAAAHTLLHLVIEATLADRGPALAMDPEVRGGATARLTWATPFIDRHRLSQWLQAVRRRVQANEVVTREPLPRDVAPHRLHAQAFHPPEDPYPGPETSLECVFIGQAMGLPCDGTHVQRTGELGEVVVRAAHPDKQGRFVTVWHARGA